MIKQVEFVKLQEILRSLARQCEDLLNPEWAGDSLTTSPSQGKSAMLVQDGPEVRLQGSNLYVDGVIVPLASRPKTLALIEAFTKSSVKQLSSEQIVEKVYFGQSQSISERLRLCSHQNMIKLTSRSRRFLEGAVNTHCEKYMIEWFCHDKDQKTWLLYRYYPLIKPSNLS